MEDWTSYYICSYDKSISGPWLLKVLRSHADSCSVHFIRGRMVGEANKEEHIMHIGCWKAKLRDFGPRPVMDSWQWGHRSSSKRQLQVGFWHSGDVLGFWKFFLSHHNSVDTILRAALFPQQWGFYSLSILNISLHSKFVLSTSSSRDVTKLWSFLKRFFFSFYPFTGYSRIRGGIIPKESILAY